MFKNDIERGYNGGLYPGMIESPALRWAFIRKVYTIISLQMLLTVAISCVVVFVRPIPEFITTTKAGLAVYICSLILPFIFLCPLLMLHKKHPINLILLALFTITISFGVGLSCSFSKGRVVLEAVSLTCIMVVGLTLYTFWAVKRGRDFSFLGPFLFGALLVLIFFCFLQVLFPLGRLSHTIFSGLAALLFCAYIVYDTNNLIKQYTYDEYVCAAVSLYLDIVNIFLALLGLLRDT